MTQNQTGKLHLALQFLRPQSLFFNELHLKPVSAEKSQNQHKYKCKLKKIRLSLDQVLENRNCAWGSVQLCLCTAIHFDTLVNYS